MASSRLSASGAGRLAAENAAARHRLVQSSDRLQEARAEQEQEQKAERRAKREDRKRQWEQLKDQIVSAAMDGKTRQVLPAVEPLFCNRLRAAGLMVSTITRDQIKRSTQLAEKRRDRLLRQIQQLQNWLRKRPEQVAAREWLLPVWEGCGAEEIVVVLLGAEETGFLTNAGSSVAERALHALLTKIDKAYEALSKVRLPEQPPTGLDAATLVVWGSSRGDSSWRAGPYSFGNHLLSWLASSEGQQFFSAFEESVGHAVDVEDTAVRLELNYRTSDGWSLPGSATMAPSPEIICDLLRRLGYSAKLTRFQDRLAGASAQPGKIVALERAGLACIEVSWCVP